MAYETEFQIFRLFIGLFGSLSNLMLVVVFTCFKSMRRSEYILPCALAVADTIWCMGVTEGAVVNLVYGDSAHVTVSFCLKTIKAYSNPLGRAMAAYISVAITCERIVATKFPIYYRTHVSARSIAIAACVSVVIPLIHVIVMIVDAQIAMSQGVIKTDKKVGINCRARSLYRSEMVQFFNIMLVAVLWIVAVGTFALLYSIMTAKSDSDFDELRKRHKERNRHISRMLSYMLICTFLLATVPQTMIYFSGWSTVVKNTDFYRMIISKISWSTLILLNAVNNAIFYIWKNSEVRAKAWLLLRCDRGANKEKMTPKITRTK